jgi:hypothetical protein
MLDKVRFLAAAMYNASGHAKKPVKPTDIMKLSIDTPVKVVKKPTPQQMIEAWQQKQRGLK